MPRAADEPVAPYGATRLGVTGLVPEARLLPGDTIPVGKYGITEGQVDRWIDELSGSVAVLLDGWERLTDIAVLDDDEVTVIIVGDRTRLRSSARDLVHNAVASYVEAGRHPERAGVNDTSYAAVLWARYTDGLEQLVAWLTKRLDDLEPGDEPDAEVDAGGPAFYFPTPLIGDGLRF
jgi:hypothetical protein